ncbi:MAG TPA: pyruvate formate lyase family protein [Victivallales bacterium]|nr:pyruvate formate lyase family protein [Victivallales bacterium]
MDFGSTSRTKQLKKDLVSKACYGGKYSDGIFVDISRPKLYMESMKKTEGLEAVIRRAESLKYVLGNIAIDILPNEMIVGNPHADPHALPIFPEINTGLLKEAIDDGYVLKKDQNTAHDLIEYFEPRSIAHKVSDNMSDELKEIVENSSSFISTTWKDGIQHCVPNWDYLFENGTLKIREKINKKLREVSQIISDENSTDLAHLIDAKQLYKGMLIALDGLECFVDRYRNLALEKAEKSNDVLEKADLLKIAEHLKTTLREPPKGVWEACQSFFFLHLILNCIDSCAFGSLVRIDQAFYPFYEKDVKKEKNITEEEAQELIECLILKVQALGGFFSRRRRLHFEGNGALPIWSIGGVKEDGSDACNELTDVILRAAQFTRCNQPTISMVYHDKMRNSSLEEAIKLIRTGIGYPSITNMKWMVDRLVMQGTPLKDARNAGVVGCVSCCPVNSCNTTKRLALTVIAAKCFELALNEGKCQITGKLIGVKEKKASEFKNYDEVVEAFNKQISFAVKSAVNVRNLARYYEMKNRPNPLASALHRTPLEKGVDVVSYEDFPNNYWLNMVGMVNVINSLAVIKKLVFEEKKYKMQELCNAVNHNWKDMEVMRQVCRNKVPKYGNNIPYVDDIAKKITSMCSEIGKHTYDINGGYWSILAQSVSIYKATASMTGAMPDGKLAGKPVADGGISPDHGTDREGIFSILESASKINHVETKGLLLNQWLAPELIDGREGIKWMKSMLKMWYDKGLSQIQLNVVDPKVLRDAQRYPENYPNLTIRVSGYTANWVKLTTELQEIILSRTCQKK